MPWVFYKLGVDFPDMHTLIPFKSKVKDWQCHQSSIQLLRLSTQIHGGIRFFNRDTPPLPQTTEPDPRVPRTCSPDGVEVGPVSFWSGLINGQGRHRDVPLVKTRLSTFKVQSNAQYRFRLIGAQSLFAFRFSIDEHKLTLIATDGHFIQPRVVDFIIIHSGERYDFLLETKNEMLTNYIIRAETLEVEGSNRNNCASDDFMSKSQMFTNHTAEAILHYGDEDVSNSMYASIYNASKPKSVECANSTLRNCKAVNCPFKQFPKIYGIECIHIHELELLNLNSGVYLQRLRYTTINTIFFNFGFEGDGSTSAMNGRKIFQHFVKDPRHPIPLVDVDLDVAVKKPVSRIVGSEINNSIPSCWNKNCVLEGRYWSMCLP